MNQDYDTRPAILQFDRFRLERRGGLFRKQKNGAWDPIIVGARAFDVLWALLNRPGEVVSKTELMAMVWPAMTVEEANLTVQISALRRILDADREDGSFIQTVIGRGYRFLPAVEVIEPSGRGIRVEIEKYSVETERRRLSIVVLPFSCLSDDREQRFLADGITVDLTTALSRIKEAFIISCNTAFTYRDKGVETRRIARELGVRFVLEGSVQRSGDRIRVNAQLIDGVTDSHVWAQWFDQDIADLMMLQSEVVSRIAIELNLELINAEAARPGAASDGLDCIIRGRSIGWQALSRENYAQRIRLYEQACALDERSVEARSRLALVLAGRVLDQMTDSAEADLARAEDFVGQALALSPLSPIAHYASGHLLRAQRRYEDAIGAYEFALASHPNWVAAIGFLGASKLLAGRIDEVIPAQERAIRLSPRDPEIWAFYLNIGIVHVLRARVSEGIFWLERSRACNVGHALAHAWLASAFALTGDIGRASGYLAAARRLGDGRYDSIGRLRAVAHFGVPAMVALFEGSFVAGLIKAGVPEE